MALAGSISHRGVYGRHAFERYVAEDAARLREVIGRDHQAVRLA